MCVGKRHVCMNVCLLVHKVVIFVCMRVICMSVCVCERFVLCALGKYMCV